MAKPTQTAAAVAPTKEVAVFDKHAGLVSRMAQKMGIEPTTFLTTLKQTAFRQRGKNNAPPVEVSNEQMAMMLHIAEKYDLDPFVKQLYAFASDGGITPIVPIDGWLAIINRHPQFESMEIEPAPPSTESADYWCAVTITRKDRKKPVRVEEWLKECYRDTAPWNEMPKRMLRHKAIIQCARVAFGYSGIFDPDEEERIYANAIDVTPTKEPPKAKPVTREPREISNRQSTAGESRALDVKAISLDQSTAIVDKCKEEGVELNAVLARFEVGSIDELPEVNFGNALHFIDELSSARLDR